VGGVRDLFKGCEGSGGRAVGASVCLSEVECGKRREVRDLGIRPL